MAHNLTGTTWVFNTTLSGWTLLYEEVTFISNDITFSLIQHYSGSSGWQLRYGTSSANTVYYATLGWVNDAYKTVEFTSADAVSDSFYDWLSANAVIAQADVIITYKNAEIGSLFETGIKTINTAGKYCEDNITVSYTKQPMPIPASGVSF